MYKIILGIILTVLTLGLFLIYTIYYTPKAPLQLISEARSTLAISQKSLASKKDKKILAAAESLYDSAIFHWQKQNESWIWFRNFQKVDSFAHLSISKAEEAVSTHNSRQEKQIVGLSKRIEILENMLLHYRKVFRTIPQKKEDIQKWATGELTLSEAKTKYHNRDYDHAEDKLVLAENYLIPIYETLNQKIVNYFTNYNTWLSWQKKVIDDSSVSRKSSLVVDKLARKCFVYAKGKLIKEYSIELGPNWLGTKWKQGDKATPEGIYTVKKKKDEKNTKYHKALLLNYPNEEDKARFELAKINGSVGKNASIGALIEIHGAGGKGTDWTDGCVALTSPDMDEVYQLVQEGSKIAIVGSLKPLSTYSASKW